ncbi:MAG: hypothetical protein IJ679_02375 [Lachnospiraceae bacterium]|nr:hypothetical protein [Lachnospiraceae bacterium]
MTGLEIALLIVGVLFFIGSFFFVEKLSSSDIDTIQKMSEKEINVLLEKQLNAVSDRMEKTLESKYNESLNKFDRETNRRTTEEIYSISEHGETVTHSIDQKLNQAQEEFKQIDTAHKEIVFLHNMLSDKEEKVSELEKEARALESNLRNMKKSVEDAIERLYAEQKIRVETAVANPPQVRTPVFPELTPQTTASVQNAAKLTVQEVEEVVEARSQAEEFSPVLSVTAVEPEPVEAPPTPQPPEDASGNINERILSMHREGYTDVDIARSLGRGVGEIRLVLGLFDEGE